MNYFIFLLALALSNKVKEPKRKSKVLLSIKTFPSFSAHQRYFAITIRNKNNLQRQLSHSASGCFLHGFDADDDIAVATSFAICWKIRFALGFTRFDQLCDHDDGWRLFRPHHQPKVVDGVVQWSLCCYVRTGISILSLKVRWQEIIISLADALFRLVSFSNMLRELTLT